MARRQQYTNEAMIAALKKRRGLIYLAAKTLGCNPDTIHDRAKISPEVAACIKAARGELIDEAENRLWIALKKGEPWATALVLKTIGKSRGYVEKSDLDLSKLNENELGQFHQLFAKAAGTTY